MPEYKYVTYETVDDGTIARVMLNRPDVRNAQNRGMIVELDDALMRAEADDTVRVVILGGVGPAFSSGHDMGSAIDDTERTPGPDQHPTYGFNGGTRKGAEERMLQEWHYFFENTSRWRDLRKITVAQVQGRVYAAGLMFMFACDLIVAAEDASFVDVVGTRLGMCGVEYFAHPWEFGPRKTKELMLTGDYIDAEEAHRLGIVSKIFPNDELSEKTLDFARRIAALPTVTALLIKESVNQTVDIMGFQNALRACFTIHQLNHAHWAEIHKPSPRLHGEELPAEMADDQSSTQHRTTTRAERWARVSSSGSGLPAALPEDGVPDWHEMPPLVPAGKNSVR